MLISKKHLSGFTIVELLIVIVVIGILAAIATVSYVGVQNRAKNANVVSGMNTYIKSLSLYVADKGTYPVPAGGFIACFGSTNNCNGGASATYTAQLATELLPYTNGASATLLAGMGSLINSTSNYTMPDGGANFTGMYIYFVQRGTSDCPAPANLRPMWSSVSGVSDVVCRFALPLAP